MSQRQRKTVGPLSPAADFFCIASKRPRNGGGAWCHEHPSALPAGSRQGPLAGSLPPLPAAGGHSAASADRSTATRIGVDGLPLRGRACSCRHAKISPPGPDGVRATG
jgi:hypothetical protein